jgi:hypothetical protein
VQIEGIPMKRSAKKGQAGLMEVSFMYASNERVSIDTHALMMDEITSGSVDLGRSKW